MDILVIGFALFAMFFGAGNLIFPPTLGNTYGSSWLLSGVSFSIMAVGLTIMALISVAKKQGDMFKFTSIAGKRLSKVVILVVLLCIGPMYAMPRTSATTMEIFNAVGFHVSPIIFSTLFFGLVLFFAFRESTVVDVIGKFMTPVLLLCLAILFIGGIINPIGEIAKTDMASLDVTTNSLIEGYNTMDSLATLAFTIVVVKSVLAKGYKDQLIKKTIQSSLIAIVFLSIVYIGLTYLGATTSSVIKGEISRVDLLIFIADKLIGNVGKIILALAMMMACFTTALGLATSISDIFNEFSKNKVSYKKGVVICCIVSAILSVFGVETLIKLAVPFLIFIYPIVILLVIYNLFDKKINSTILNTTFSVVTFVCAIQGIRDFINTLGSVFNLDLGIFEKIADLFDKIVSLLPLSDIGFPWIVPFVISLILSLLYSKLVRKEKSLA